MISKREGAIISAHVGVLLGDFEDLHEYIEEILERPVLTDELYKDSIVGEIKEKSRNDFINLKVGEIVIEEQKCRVCGCTWNNACEGSCYWVEEDLCSKCCIYQVERMRSVNRFEKCIKEGLSEEVNSQANIILGCIMASELRESSKNELIEFMLELQDYLEFEQGD